MVAPSGLIKLISWKFKILYILFSSGFLTAIPGFVNHYRLTNLKEVDKNTHFISKLF